jgi:hypothetical protein
MRTVGGLEPPSMSTEERWGSDVWRRPRRLEVDERLAADSRLHPSIHFSSLRCHLQHGLCDGTFDPTGWKELKRCAAGGLPVRGVPVLD